MKKLAVIFLSLFAFSANCLAQSSDVTSLGSTSTMPIFAHTEDTKGSRYLFSGWVNGFVVDPSGAVYKDASYNFNYDKISGTLLLTKDKTAAIEIDKSKIKTFTLYNDQNQPQVYECVPAIDAKHFARLIASGSKYKIYKLTITTFIKNNFHNDGMTQTGNNYDEFSDEDTYYLLNQKTSQVSKFSLKKKSILNAFADEKDKAARFTPSNADGINDAYVKELGDYMNN